MAEQQLHALFDDGRKTCEICHRILPKDYTGTLCPACIEQALFSEVKDYIRENDVTEFDVADHFQIPLHKVKGWIREGRIQYKELHTPALKNLHCQKCGEPIQFGTLCSKCQRKSTTSGSMHVTADRSKERFRYL